MKQLHHTVWFSAGAFSCSKWTRFQQRAGRSTAESQHPQVMSNVVVVIPPWWPSTSQCNTVVTHDLKGKRVQQMCEQHLKWPQHPAVSRISSHTVPLPRHWGWCPAPRHEPAACAGYGRSHSQRSGWDWARHSPGWCWTDYQDSPAACRTESSSEKKWPEPLPHCAATHNTKGKQELDKDILVFIIFIYLD